MNQKLLLFDIDGTLLDTRGAGASSLLDAAEEVFNVQREDIPALDLAGATDGGVIRKLFADAKHPYSENVATNFRLSYLKHLEKRLHHIDFKGQLLHGVEALLPKIQQTSHFSVGLLTGNWRSGAMLKLQRFGIEEYFLDGGFGDDGEFRNDLGPAAVKRMEVATKRRFKPEDVIVIGDTPKDIACAHAMGARCLAVATGVFDHPSLLPFGSWQVIKDLSDSDHVLELLSS